MSHLHLGDLSHLGFNEHSTNFFCNLMLGYDSVEGIIGSEDPHLRRGMDFYRWIQIPLNARKVVLQLNNNGNFWSAEWKIPEPETGSGSKSKRVSEPGQVSDSEKVSETETDSGKASETVSETELEGPSRIFDPYFHHENSSQIYLVFSPAFVREMGCETGFKVLFFDEQDSPILTKVRCCGGMFSKTSRAKREDSGEFEISIIRRKCSGDQKKSFTDFRIGQTERLVCESSVAKFK